MSSSFDRVSAALQRSQMLRLLSVGFLVLLLQIPIAMIGGLISERQIRRDRAIEDVSSKWGGVQSITGPVLVIPYTSQWTEAAANGQLVTRSKVRHAIFLPTRLTIRGRVETETRKRGIFSIPVYRLALEARGEVAEPDLAALDVDPATALWERAHVAIGISDVRAIQQEATLSWGGRSSTFLPGSGGFSDSDTGIHAVVGAGPPGPVEFSFPLVLNGSLGAYFSPFARNTVVEIESNSRNPSFQGNWLPSKRSISDSGFRASWSIPFLGRNYPQAWTSTADMGNAIEASRFGVELSDPVDHYRMAERSVKYAGLFVLLTFTVIWLIEVLAGLRVHPIQYLMLGGALCLFYLLELSLSEHVGFPVAYAIASVAVVGMVGAYCLAVLHNVRRALVVAAGVAALYVYLYVLLMNEDYALLIGSVGLFAILGAVMYVTRRVQWYGARGDDRPTAPPA
jgi:inner membrane protein